MKNYLSILAFLLFTVNNNTSAQNQAIEFKHGTFNEILEIAKKENKIVFVDCFTTWCGPCQMMAKNIFTNDNVAEFYNKNFINAKIDMEDGEGIAIAKKYNISAYPTMLYLDANGTQLHRVCGSSAAKEFIEHGMDALKPETQLATLKNNFNVKKATAAEADGYFSKLQQACLAMDEEIEQYFANVKKEDLSSEQNWAMLNRYVDDPNSAAFKNFETDFATFTKLYGVEETDNKMVAVYMNGLYKALEENKQAEYESLKTRFLATKNSAAEKIILGMDVRGAELAGDWKKYSVLATKYLDNYDSENAEVLNNYAWKFYEKVDDKAMLAHAEVWAKKACELDNSYANTDTYAAVLFKLGKKEEAKTMAKKAINLAQDNGEDPSETQGLLLKIESLK